MAALGKIKEQKNRPKRNRLHVERRGEFDDQAGQNVGQQNRPRRHRVAIAVHDFFLNRQIIDLFFKILNLF